MQLQLPHIPDEANKMSLLLKSQILVYRREFFRDYNPALPRLSEIQQKTVNLISMTENHDQLRVVVCC